MDTITAQDRFMSPGFGAPVQSVLELARVYMFYELKAGQDFRCHSQEINVGSQEEAKEYQGYEQMH